jgi:hypothetical protein
MASGSQFLPLGEPHQGGTALARLWWDGDSGNILLTLTEVIASNGESDSTYPRALRERMTNMQSQSQLDFCSARLVACS